MTTLLRTAATRSAVEMIYAALSAIRENVNDLLPLSISVNNVLSALWNKYATTTVIESFTIVKVARLLLANPAINGLLSIAPKKKMPITVVSQSIVPVISIAGLGIDLNLSTYAPSFIFSNEFLVGLLI